MAWYGPVESSRQTQGNYYEYDEFPLNLSSKQHRKKRSFCLRQPNWTEEEKQLLIQEFNRHSDILTGGNDGQSKLSKRKAWEAIRQKVSQVSNCERSLKEVRKKWHNICFYESKKKARCPEGKIKREVDFALQIAGKDDLSHEIDKQGRRKEN